MSKPKTTRWDDMFNRLSSEATIEDLISGYMRYQYLRTLTASEFGDLWKQKFTEGEFDAAVDLLIEERLKKEDQKALLKCQCFSIEDDGPKYAEHVCGLPATHVTQNNVLMCDRHAEQYRVAYPFRIKPIEIGKGEK